MQNPIKILLSSMIALLLTSSLIAQAPSKSEERLNKRMEHLKKALELNDAQVAEINELFKKQGNTKAEIFMRGERIDATQRAAMKKEFETGLKKVLTEEQFQKFQEMPKRNRGHKRHGAKGHHKGMKSAYKEKITPILLEQRAKLESKISAEDQKILADIRAERQSHKLERKGLSREAIKAKKEAHKNNPNRIKLQELSEKYSADIEPLLAEVKEEIKAIKQEFRKEHKGKGKHKGAAKHRKAHQGDKGDEAAEHQKRHQHKKYAHFLLLDPSKSADQQIEAFATISNVSIYPNPSQGISQIEYELTQAGSVLIELRDNKGQLVYTIEQAEKTAGQHKVAVNLEQYSSGIYLVVLTDGLGNVVSEQLVK